MPLTYEPIATQTLTSATATVTFSSIPSTYTDLVLVANVKGVGTGYSQIQVNGSGSNLSRLAIAGDGSSASSGAYSDNYIVKQTTANNNNFAFNSVTNIMSYSNTTTYKTLISRVNNASVGTEACLNTWRSTDAITSFGYYLSGTNMDTGSTFTLYGIKGA
jgi:hypothetical protein